MRRFDLFLTKLLIFGILKKRVTNQPTDRRTDRPSYRDARTHLKTMKNEFEIAKAISRLTNASQTTAQACQR